MRVSYRVIAATAFVVLLGACAGPQLPPLPHARPDSVRTQIIAMMPASVRDRAGWAVDIYAAFSSLGIDPDTSNLCAVLAVAAQESSYQADPTVPRLGQIARKEMERRAESAGVPTLLLSAALLLHSRDGRSYSERIDAARTEKDLSELFDEMVDEVPLGRRLFANYNPVRTGGPMQVGIDFAQRHVKQKPYPYPMTGSLRAEVFTRRGGLYFGIAHLLDYPANYDQMIYRFADFNAGQYASRNAAFQNAASLASGIPLALDGDLVRPGGDREKPGSTELAVRTLGRRIDMGDSAIRRALEQGEQAADFEQSALHRRVFELAEQIERRSLPRAVLPRIALQSPKITRALTTEWFARRVDERYARCVRNAPAVGM